MPRQTLDTQVALVAQDQGTVEADRATVKSAEVNLQYCRILSPLDGRVGLRLVDQGNYVTPGDASGLVVITQLQPISVLFTVPEDNLQAISKRLQAGAVLPATAYDRSGSQQDRRRHAADLRQPDRSHHRNDQAAGAVRERSQALFPNQFVNVRLLLDTHKDVTTMPTAGIQRGVPGTFVYLVNADSTVSVRTVVLGVTDGDRVEVISGLAPGDRVVIDGADKLRDGAKINVRAGDRAAGAPPAGARPADPEQVGQETAFGQRTKTMNPSQPFILRPVATTLLMIAIMLSGMLAFRFLPVAALPEVDYPTIQVQTFYPGASPDVMTSSVTAPLEVQFGQMPNLNQMSSVSSAGASVITLQFGLTISLDVAEQEVQAAINAAGNLLPSDLPAPPIYAKVNPADAPILTLGLTSKTMPLTQVEDFVDTRLAQKISQLPGVGLVSISGGQRPAVRIRADIRKLAAYGLNIDDLRTTLGNANINTPKGNFDGPMRAYTINANDQIRNASDYKSADRRLQERLAGPAQRCRRRRRWRPERQARRLDERDAGHHPEYPAATRRQRHCRGRGHQGAAAAVAGLAARRDRSQYPDRPDRDHPRLGARMWNSS